jgi:hypothetical protein
MYRKDFEFKEGTIILATEINWSVSEILKDNGVNIWDISWRIFSSNGQITIGPYKIKSDEGKITWSKLNSIVIYSDNDNRICVYDYENNIFIELKNDFSIVEISTNKATIIQKAPVKAIEHLKIVLENFIKCC